MTPLEQVAAALERQDYRTAAQHLKSLYAQSPDDPWVQLYVGRVQEGTGKAIAAEKIYRTLLKSTTLPKVITQARQGLQRLEAQEKARRQAAIAQATATPTDTSIGCLFLGPISNEQRQAAAQQFARIFQIDPYSARLMLSSRNWRLYRSGPIGELGFYGQELQAAGIPARWIALESLQSLRVFRVVAFTGIGPQATVKCQNEAGQLGLMAFQWAEVTQRVEGQLPIFESVVDIGAWGKLQRKEQTQDYAQICDLHLPGRGCVLRFGDYSYQFQEDGLFSQTASQQDFSTNRQRWNYLLKVLEPYLAHAPVAADFRAFAESCFEHAEILEALPSHIDLFRKQETLWDPAFQLYSGFLFQQ
ncbi:tol-pal system YbgF family protein [Geitlerinema sp. PCC 7407]|uniref:tetratricopeptide repeat protein n=1 Tax=Geitlerinema sp. PCC 7407 TaxID=1173025 RepID=UPI00029FF299|nr:tetratricopeptide repeat protein [Geitlerinema sp. PCC 7407]AFY67827.1 hypothetical protein GEI7407_3360 [Geitlerinema sp. PCC 7407]